MKRIFVPCACFSFHFHFKVYLLYGRCGRIQNLFFNGIEITLTCTVRCGTPNTQNSNTNAQFLFGFTDFDWRFEFRSSAACMHTLHTVRTCISRARATRGTHTLARIGAHLYDRRTRWQKNYYIVVRWVLQQFNRNIDAYKSNNSNKSTRYARAMLCDSDWMDMEATIFYGIVVAFRVEWHPSLGDKTSATFQKRTYIVSHRIGYINACNAIGMWTFDYSLCSFFLLRLPMRFSVKFSGDLFLSFCADALIQSAEICLNFAAHKAQVTGRHWSSKLRPSANDMLSSLWYALDEKEAVLNQLL